jgi:membrane-bound metal-dependent hydrolase YbcI (DUF457 family)
MTSKPVDPGRFKYTLAMDTITHGIAGALISKAVFRGEDMVAIRAMNRARIVTWSLMLGAIFPDSDVFREFFSKNDLLILTWHRSITHSLLCMPLFALALAALTRRVARWRNWDAPSFAALTGIYAIGIVSHIVLDLVTSFGTMIWSPVKWSRPAWDLIFIVDFTFSAILLLPQMLAWVYSRPEGLQRRALGTWLVFCAGTLLAAFIGQSVRAPFSPQAIIAALVVLTALFLLPALRGRGLRVGLASWNRAGFVAAIGYLALAMYLHHAALARVDQFASQLHLEVQSRGALPFPPSLWHWDGLVLTPRGVYETRMDLSDASNSGGPESSALTYRFYPDAPPNTYINAAMQLREVQAVLWFSRFPVTRFRKEGDGAVVEISDLRFPQIRPDRPASFTYRVRFSAAGAILSQGWVNPR